MTTDISAYLRNEFTFEEETPTGVSTERLVVGDVVDLSYDKELCHKTLIYGGCVKGVHCYYDPLGKCIIIPEKIENQWKVGHIEPKTLRKLLPE